MNYYLVTLLVVGSFCTVQGMDGSGDGSDFFTSIRQRRAAIDPDDTSSIDETSDMSHSLIGSFHAAPRNSSHPPVKGPDLYNVHNHMRRSSAPNAVERDEEDSSDGDWDDDDDAEVGSSLYVPPVRTEEEERAEQAALEREKQDRKERFKNVRDNLSTLFGSSPALLQSSPHAAAEDQPPLEQPPIPQNVSPVSSASAPDLRADRRLTDNPGQPQLIVPPSPLPVPVSERAAVPSQEGGRAMHFNFPPPRQLPSDIRNLVRAPNDQPGDIPADLLVRMVPEELDARRDRRAAVVNSDDAEPVNEGPQHNFPPAPGAVQQQLAQQGEVQAPVNHNENESGIDVVPAGPEPAELLSDIKKRGMGATQLLAGSAFVGALAYVAMNYFWQADGAEEVSVLLRPVTAG